MTGKGLNALGDDEAGQAGGVEDGGNRIEALGVDVGSHRGVGATDDSAIVGDALLGQDVADSGLVDGQNQKKGGQSEGDFVG